MLEAAKVVWDLCREVLDDPDPRVKVFALLVAVGVLIIVAFVVMCFTVDLPAEVMVVGSLLLFAMLVIVAMKVIHRIDEAGHARTLGHCIYKVEHQFTAATAVYGFGAGSGTIQAEAQD